MKKTVIAFSTFALITLIFAMNPVKSYANDFDWKAFFSRDPAVREQAEKERMEKWLDELEADGNLTQQAIDAAGKYGVGRVPNNPRGSGSKSSKSSGNSYSSGNYYSGGGKGWVYGCDELHVIGLPEGANGYTKPGYYGDVDGSYSSGSCSGGKGWVYSADELHVIGLPTGEGGYTLPGYYGDIDN